MVKLARVRRLLCSIDVRRYVRVYVRVCVFVE